MNDFFVLKPEGMMFGTRWAYAMIVKPQRMGEPKKCPVCNAPIAMRSWLPPHYVRLSTAKVEKWGDCLWGAGFSLMVSSRFKTLYEANNLTGIVHFDPTAGIMRVGNRKTDLSFPNLPEYHLVDIVWNGANLDDVGSGAVRRQVVCAFDRGGVVKLERIVLERGTWTGADIFGVRGLPGRILVSIRFKEFAVEHGLSNVALISAEEYAYDMSRPGGWYVRHI